MIECSTATNTLQEVNAEVNEWDGRLSQNVILRHQPKNLKLATY